MSSTIDRQVLALAVPALGALVAEPLFVLVDSAIVGRALQLPQDEVEDRLERLEREHALVNFSDEHECPDRSLTLRYRF